MTHTARHSTDFDKNLGAFIRHRRKRLKLSQVELASAIGVTYQQVQKYETGANRLSVERLFKIATVLRTPTRFFSPPQLNQTPQIRLRNQSRPPPNDDPVIYHPAR